MVVGRWLSVRVMDRRGILVVFEPTIECAKKRAAVFETPPGMVPAVTLTELQPPAVPIECTPAPNPTWCKRSPVAALFFCFVGSVEKTVFFPLVQQKQLERELSP